MSRSTNTRVIYTRSSGKAANQRVGDFGEIWYNPTNGELRVSDGETPGGTVINGGGSGGGISTKIQNGTSKVEIASADGAIAFNSDQAVMSFASDGSLEIPGYIYGLGTIRIDNSATGTSADIELHSADNIVIQGKNQDPGVEREGGDISITGGRGAGGPDGTGGDISVVSGAGGNATETTAGGDGGFTTIGCRTGGEANAANSQSAGNGSQLQLYAGSGGFNDGDSALGGTGGNVNINAGTSTTIGGAGVVNINAGIDDAGTPGNIVFGAGRSKELTYKEAIAALAFTPVPLMSLGSAAAAGAGARAFISDSTPAPYGNFGQVASGGGAEVSPVFSNGFNWLMG